MGAPTISLEQLNASSTQDFVDILGPVFENAPWVCETAWQERPFASLTSLHQFLIARLAELSENQLLSFLRGHPRLSPETLRGGTTAESTHEQKAAGLDRLDAATMEQLEQWNVAYEARFGFPFILAVRHASLATLRESFKRRLESSPEMERKEAIAEISAISWMRLLDRIRPAKTGGLSTHVLDTVRSTPATGLNGELWSLSQTGATKLLVFQTDEGGHAEIQESESLSAGRYEWRFDTTTYFAAQGYSSPSRSYLGDIRIAFSIWNPEEHYHVPVLLSPGSYTTYRGN